jgi:hypothetical protein
MEKESRDNKNFPGLYVFCVYPASSNNFARKRDIQRDSTNLFA